LALIDSELQNGNLLGWLTRVLTVMACYYVDDTLFAAVFLISGVIAGAFMLTWFRRPWWQQLIVLLWSLSPIGFMVLDLRVGAYIDSKSASAESTPLRWHRR
jgi:hypothetical protein